MKIKFLGTAAAEGFPAIFCNCSSCVEARKAGGKNIRTRNQILVNDDLLVDFPPDSFMHALRNNTDFSAVKHVLFTHSHPDHFYPLELVNHGKPYAYNMTSENLNVCGNRTVIKSAKKLMKPELRGDVKNTLTLTAIEPYQTFSAGEYEITALPAEHSANEDCFVYLIRHDGKTYFVFNDSGVLSDSVYDFMRENCVKIDIVSFDCTYGYARRGFGRHMGMLDNADERDRMQKLNLVHANTKFVITHFSHNGKLLYHELNEKAAELNFITAYDGLEIEV